MSSPTPSSVPAGTASEGLSATDMVSPTYPSLFKVADHAAIRGRKRTVQVTLIDILLALGAAAFTSLTTFLTSNSVAYTVSTAAAVLVVLGLVERSIVDALRPQQGWYDTRAAAEAIKSNAWRYMMRVTPYEVDRENADRRFVSALAKIYTTHVRVAVIGEQGVSATAITPSMSTVRALDLDGRKRYYRTHRLSDQIAYYHWKCREQGNRARLWSWSNMTARVITLVFAVLYFWRSEFGTLVGLFAGVTLALAAWTQLMRHDDLANSYRSGAEALQGETPLLEAAITEESLARSVLRIEDLMTQEHVTWTTKRS